MIARAGESYPPAIFDEGVVRLRTLRHKTGISRRGSMSGLSCTELVSFAFEAKPETPTFTTFLRTSKAVYLPTLYRTLLLIHFLYMIFCALNRVAYYISFCSYCSFYVLDLLFDSS